MKSLKSFLAIAALTAFLIDLDGQISTPGTGLTASAVIGMIIEKTGAPVIPNTVDVIKEGNPETKITGIVTTMFASMPVLKKAVEMNCNMIIVHEPLYYNHADQTSQFMNDPVFLEKQKYIRDHKLVIWRFHDYIHSTRPDGILTGMVSKLGWKAYVVNDKLDEFSLPETTLENILKNLKKVFPGNAFYVIGDPRMKVRKVRLAPGAPGSSTHIRILGQTDTEVLIAGEVPQWETYEYMRDAFDQGRKKAVIFIGHVNSEEAGMEHCADWLKGFIRDIPVSFVGSGPSYWTY
ncbi:MAG TPA: Nif3-like dinuclear metal center hexameric protein [Bacteroidales bacterium]|jgi:putative NIF3 family GTP cyclohydrolase 1 type 2|nr:Nif3-like dinuclear metal center hexameric protein [Bacteroidales bacterium]